MKAGISLYSYGGDLHSRRMSVRQAIRHAAEIGCEGIELIGDQHLPNWPYTSISDLLDLRDLIESLGMEVSCFSSYLIYMLRSDRNQTQEELISVAQEHIKIANMLGAKICRPIYSADNKKDLFHVINACLPILNQYNIIWALEVHSPFPPSFYNEVIQEINSPFVRLLPDFSCWQSMGLPTEFSANNVETFKEILPYTAYCHGKAHVFDANGEEPNTPYKALMEALKAVNFDGYVVAEYEGWLMGYADSRTIVKTHFDLINKYR